MYGIFILHQREKVGGRWKDLIPKGPPPAGGVQVSLKQWGWNLPEQNCSVGGRLFSSSADHHLTFVSLLPCTAHGVLGRAINLIRKARAEKDPSPPAVSSVRALVHKLGNGSTGFIH